MCKAYEGALDETLIQDPKKAEEALKEHQERQRSWCKRKSGSGTISWRPKKRYRVSAFHWARNVDNQIKHSLGLQGLQSFVPQDLEWQKWRHMNVAIDQGGDGLSACNYLLAVGCCLTIWCDFSHGANNDVNGTIKDI